MTNTNRLTMPLIQASQAQKHVTHNEAMAFIDNALQLTFLSTDQVAPPVSPTIGDTYGVADSATGDWSFTTEGDIASWGGDAWYITSPSVGWSAWDVNTGAFVMFSGGSWIVQSPNFQNLAGVGIGTTSDATNKLAVSSDATLLNHAGNGHQVKVNKNVIGDTASLLFQTGFSGRAEMGTAGNDDFIVKVSADGSTWFNGLSVSPVDGKATVRTLNISDIPTSAAGLVSGDVWSNAGVLTVVS